MPRLLFTGGGGAGSEALYRLLSDRYVVHFADADVDARPAGVPHTAWHTVPLASAPEFLHELARLCASLDIDVLIPGVDEELLSVAEERHVLGCEVLLPPAHFVAAHLDKLTSNALLRSFGVAVPATEPLPRRRRVAFPCILKPRRGRGSRNVAIVASEDEVRAHLLAWHRDADDFVVQELLHGQEYTVTVVADVTGTLRAVVPVRVGVKRGITLRAETHADQRVMAVCAEIHAASPVPGCFNVQLIKSVSGDVQPFEVNARISTTACLVLASGVNFIDLYLAGAPAAHGNAAALASFEEGLQLRRSWQNEFLRG